MRWGGEWLSGLRPRDRRAIRIGLMVLVPAFVLVGLVVPYARALDEARDRLAAERTLLARERALLQTTPDLEVREIAVGTAVTRRAPRLFEGDPTLAAGALVRYVAERAVESRVLLEATETAGVDPVGAGVEGVRVRVRGVGDVAGVLELLRLLEDGQRLVRIEQLSLERRDVRGLPAPDDPADPVQPVSLNAVVVGYSLAGRVGAQ